MKRYTAATPFEPATARANLAEWTVGPNAGVKCACDVSSRWD